MIWIGSSVRVVWKAAASITTANPPVSRMMEVLALLWFGGGRWYKHRIAFDDVILAAQRLRHVRIEEGDEAERTERLRYEYVSYLAKLGKVVFQVLGGQVFGAAADKHFAR